MSRLDVPNSDAATGEGGAGKSGGVDRMPSRLGDGPEAEAVAADLDARRPRGKQQYVYNLSVVRACPMYGYYPEERLFIKIML